MRNSSEETAFPIHRRASRTISRRLVPFNYRHDVIASITIVDATSSNAITIYNLLFTLLFQAWNAFLRRGNSINVSVLGCVRDAWTFLEVSVLMTQLIDVFPGKTRAAKSNVLSRRSSKFLWSLERGVALSRKESKPSVAGRLVDNATEKPRCLRRSFPYRRGNVAFVCLPWQPVVAFVERFALPRVSCSVCRASSESFRPESAWQVTRVRNQCPASFEIEGTPPWIILLRARQRGTTSSIWSCSTKTLLKSIRLFMKLEFTEGRTPLILLLLEQFEKKKNIYIYI